MYNCVALKEPDWCFQRYLWEENLDPDRTPEEKVIKTLIYGVRSSGNLAEHSIRETAKLSEKEYPDAHEIICKDIYVDDCISGGESQETANSLADQLEVVLNRGGFTLKGIAFSGKDPPESLSEDGVSIAVGGLKWFTKQDMLSLNLGEMNFGKKCRGRKSTQFESGIPEKITRRHCVSKVAEVFDILGKFTPIIATMKLDLHELIQRKLDWDDTIPDAFRPVWLSHFEMIQELKNIKFHRAIVPPDAINLDIDTIDFGDASTKLICAAIYARFRRKDGTYSSQLVFSRSRIVPDTMSLPRAELYAAVLNTHTGELVRRSFYKNHKHALKLTDSQIVLHWITNEARPLKQWVRSRVIEILRFTNVKDWKYIDTRNMMADIGTRRGSKLTDVVRDSLWINGFEWMHCESKYFPVKNSREIILNQEEIFEVKKEVPYINLFDQTEKLKAMEQPGSFLITSNNVPTEVNERYLFSKYMIDPNKHPFGVVVRIIAIVLKFIKMLKEGIKQTRRKTELERKTIINPRMCLSDKEINAAETYLFKAATAEVKKFMKKEQYMKISREDNGILKYTGRILPSNEVVVVGNMTDAMKDLKSTTFCVPVVEKHSPIAYSIAIDVHWNNPVVKHSGIETMWRYVLKKAYIIEGREIVKKVKRSCERCRYLIKKTIDVSMGSISNHNLTIAPAFYISQVDIAGPFKSFSHLNKRSSIKIWLTVFCCATTAMTNIKVMEDYSSTSFIQAFIRLACEVGYPKVLLTDSGSQLVKGCNEIRFEFQDLKFKLHKNSGVELEMCPVGGHNMNGKVERKIREIKKSFEKNIYNERLSLIQWETVAAEVANSLNDLPLALGNFTSDFESMDIITPNRLRLGRNNERSPVGGMLVTNNHNRILEENKIIFNTWFENWLLTHVPKLIEQPKWFKNEESLKKDDIVLFLKEEKVICSSYQYGMVESVEHGKDGLIRKAKVRYRNHNEKVDRVTFRSVRHLIVIHHIEETNILQELGEIANYADLKLKMNIANFSAIGGECKLRH